MLKYYPVPLGLYSFRSFLKTAGNIFVEIESVGHILAKFKRALHRCMDIFYGISSMHGFERISKNFQTWLTKGRKERTPL